MLLPLRRRRPLEAGKVNFVAIVLLLLLVAFVYFVITVVPPWARNRRVDTNLREAGYQAWKIKNDEELRAQIMDRQKKLFPKEKSLGRTPQFEAQDISIERDVEAKKVYIDLAYSVIIDFPFIKKETEHTYELHVVGDLTPPSREDKEKSEWMKWLTE